MDNAMDIIKERINESISVKKALLADEELLFKIEESANQLVECFKRGNKVLFCGNGGSAADAQHLAAEFSGRYLYDRPPLPAEALHVNTSYFTAVGNDYGFDLVYSRYLAGVGREGDILIGLSTSGNSLNIVNAMRKARELGMQNIAMTGETGGEMKGLSDILLNVPSIETPRIQESHITIGHIVCEIVESSLFPR